MQKINWKKCEDISAKISCSCNNAQLYMMQIIINKSKIDGTRDCSRQSLMR